MLLYLQHIKSKVSVTNEDKFSNDIATILDTAWDKRKGQVVPDTDDVALADGAVTLDAAILYADLYDSTKLVRTFGTDVPAKVIRAYLSSMTRLVKRNGGIVKSFDGDRVMGVFIGDTKNTSAAQCALEMHHVVMKVLKPQVEDKFPEISQEGFKVAHCAGIANGPVMVVRGGVRGKNDLVFTGSAPNIAAKLSDSRDTPYFTYITWTVYRDMLDETKFSLDGEENIWTKASVTVAGEEWDCYKSSWMRRP